MIASSCYFVVVGGVGGIMCVSLLWNLLVWDYLFSVFLWVWLTFLVGVFLLVLSVGLD